MATKTKGRPQGGDGAARPSAKSLLQRLLLPLEVTDPRVLRAWADPRADGVAKLGAPRAELTAGKLHAVLLKAAAAGRLELLLVENELLIASACSDTPACCRVAVAAASVDNGEEEP